MDTLIYRVGTKSFNLRMKWPFQKYTGFFKIINANYRKRAINWLKTFK